MPKFNLTIPGQTISLKNSKRRVTAGGRPMLLPSEAYELWAEASLWQLNQCPLVGQKWNYPLLVDFHFYRKTKAIFDYINMGQGPLDLMITAGIIADDDMNHIIPGQWAWDLDKENPRVEITIIDYLMEELR